MSESGGPAPPVVCRAGSGDDMQLLGGRVDLRLGVLPMTPVSVRPPPAKRVPPTPVPVRAPRALITILERLWSPLCSQGPASLAPPISNPCTCLPDQSQAQPRHRPAPYGCGQPVAWRWRGRGRMCQGRQRVGVFRCKVDPKMRPLRHVQAHCPRTPSPWGAGGTRGSYTKSPPTRSPPDRGGGVMSGSAGPPPPGPQPLVTGACRARAGHCAAPHAPAALWCRRTCHRCTCAHARPKGVGRTRSCDATYTRSFSSSAAAFTGSVGRMNWLQNIAAARSA